MAEFQLGRIRFNWQGVWSGGTDYNIDDMVEYQGSTYVAKRVHISSDFINDLAGSDLTPAQPKWEKQSEGVTWEGDWTVSTVYAVGNIVKYGSAIYQCIEGHTSAATFSSDTDGLQADINKWTLVAVSDTDWKGNWVTNTLYRRNDLVRYNGRVYKALNQHRSATTASQGLEANQADWSILSDGATWRGNWSIGTRYIVNDIVKYGGIVYKCITGHVSADNLTIGLEEDQSKWETLIDGLHYAGVWETTARYKKNDLVKRGPNVVKCLIGHTSGIFATDEANSYWELFMPGQEYEDVYDPADLYQPGDVVRYGGYVYIATEYTTGNTPSDTSDYWKSGIEGFSFQDEWNQSTDGDSTIVNYKIGDVVRLSGNLYLAKQDSTNLQPDLFPDYWEKLVDGRQFRNTWQDDVEYFEGDIVTWQGTSYIALQYHRSTESDSRPDNDQNQPDQNYWKIMIQGTLTNKLARLGDIKTFEDQDSTSVDTQRLAIGTSGQVLRVTGTLPSWDTIDFAENVYYVSMDGIDDAQNGGSLNAPFRTIRFACNYLLADETNRVGNGATIRVMTGEYAELLPISLPAKTALVGDELRSSVVRPGGPDDVIPQETTLDNPNPDNIDFPNDNATRNMFLVRNGTGIRRFTLKGLKGELTDANDNGFRRPTAGAYVSLDPGTGPDDQSVWISDKSCYVQGVTTFGTACVGCKVDGTLHNGGNKSIVANDFTQVLSDGVGYWVNGEGKAELVSVFTYYNYAGYLATDGGKIRATNGNNSYGTFGSVAEGFNEDETQITGEVNNRSKEAQIEKTLTDEDKVLALAYSNAGENYTSATLSFVSTGSNLDERYDEVRQQAVNNLRLEKPDDSTVIGGRGFKFITNFARDLGGDSQIYLANSETRTSAQMVGMRIFIVSGPGAGQYGYIADYNASNKLATIRKDSDNSLGWDNVIPGGGQVAEFDETTKYEIEPRITIAEPTWNVQSTSTYSGLKGIGYTDGANKWYIASANTDNFYTSDDGENWDAVDGPFSGDWVAFANKGPVMMALENNASRMAYSNDGLLWDQTNLPAGEAWSDLVVGGSNANIVMAVGTGTDSVYTGTIISQGDSSVAPSTWSTRTLTANTNWVGADYGAGRWVVIAQDGTINYSDNDGVSWTAGTAITPSSPEVYSSIAFGNNVWVASLDQSDRIMYSTDGINWNDAELVGDSGRENWTVTYGQGAFVAASATGTLATSYDGYTWTIRSNVNNLTHIAHGLINNQPTWVGISAGLFANKITGGSRAFARCTIDNGAITNFQILEPGAGYTTTPVVTITDPEEYINPSFSVYTGNGVLPQPIFYNRGTGYITFSKHTIDGDGYAEIWQTGNQIVLKNVAKEPGPGANLEFTGNSTVYRVVKTIEKSGAEPNLNLTLQVTPTLTVEKAPDHEVAITMREQYSQVRLTGHDFLDIGTGNLASTNYPGLYIFGQTANNETNQANETAEAGGGRVFYTSTDQDGNFRVGELFKVNQAVGGVTLSADLFDLGGLEEIRLGGIQLGGTQATVTEFSTDNTFTANSNSIVPTQRAIKSYIQNRFTGGGSSLNTNSLTAGTVDIRGSDIGTTEGTVEFGSTTNFTQGGVDGSMAGTLMFLDSRIERDEFNG